MARDFMDAFEELNNLQESLVQEVRVENSKVYARLNEAVLEDGYAVYDLLMDCPCDKEQEFGTGLHVNFEFDLDEVKTEKDIYVVYTTRFSSLKLNPNIGINGAVKTLEKIYGCEVKASEIKALVEKIKHNIVSQCLCLQLN